MAPRRRRTPTERGAPARFAPFFVLAVASACLLPAAALAHEQRDVGDGQYSLEVGFRDEPAYLGQPNALYLKVTAFGAGGGPVEGLAGSLEAMIEKGEAERLLALRPGPEPGVYETPFIPTALGDYTFTLFGEIEETVIDESFSSSPDTFSPVEPLDYYQFPVAAPAGAELIAQFAAANARAARGEILGSVGIAIGVLGLFVGIVGVMRTRTSAKPSADPHRDQSVGLDDGETGRALLR